MAQKKKTSATSDLLANLAKKQSSTTSTTSTNGAILARRNIRFNAEMEADLLRIRQELLSHEVTGISVQKLIEIALATSLKNLSLEELISLCEEKL